jgi:hypothetical protein
MSEFQEEDVYQEYDWDMEDYCIDCQRATVGEVCQQCGAPICPMCYEVGAGFCNEHPDYDRHK